MIKFEAVKIAWSQDKNGYILKLSIHPNDVHDELMRDPLGTIYNIVLDKEGEEGIQPPGRLSKGEGEKGRGQAAVNKGIQAAGLLCRNQRFMDFLRVRYGYGEAVSEDGARSALTDILGVDRRREIASNPAAEKRMMELADEFRHWIKHGSPTPIPGGIDL